MGDLRLQPYPLRLLQSVHNSSAGSPSTTTTNSTASMSATTWRSTPRNCSPTSSTTWTSPPRSHPRSIPHSCLSLAAGGSSQLVAVMYDHVARPVSDETVDVRPATRADHPAAVAFCRAETGSPEAFLEPFLAERIELHELYLVEADGKIAATGECRADLRAPSNAHLGLVVGSELRVGEEWAAG